MRQFFSGRALIEAGDFLRCSKMLEPIVDERRCGETTAPFVYSLSAVAMPRESDLVDPKMITDNR